MESQQPQGTGDISVRNINGRTVLAPVTALTRKNCGQLASLLAQLEKKEVTEIILDLSHVPFFDSQALEVILDTHKALKAKGGALLLSNLNDVCRDILICVRLISQLAIMDQTYHKS